MQLRHLEVFTRIVDTGTLTAAAAALHKTQSAVSQDLRALESGLGVELVDRSGQRVELTQAGAALLPMARRILAEVADARREMRRVREGRRPTIRVSCLPSLAPTMVPLIARFSAEEPEARWSLGTALRRSIIDGIRNGRVDVGVCEARAEDGIINDLLAREALEVVVPADHPVAAVSPVRPADLADLPYIGLDRSLGASGAAQRFFDAASIAPTPLIEVTDTRLVIELVVALRGFGVVPASTQIAGMHVAALATDPPLERQLALVRADGRRLPAATAAFADYLARHWPADGRPDR